MWKKRLISAFILLNLATVLFANTPVWLTTSGERLLQSLPPLAATSLRLLAGLDRIYGNAVGLDNRGSLFSNPIRVASWQEIRAEYAGGERVLLPLAGQSERTFWQRNLFDFREEMLRHGLSRRRAYRAAYADYLCRTYPSHNGQPVRAIVWEVYHQDVVNIYQASRTGSHVDPRSTSKRSHEVFRYR